MEDCKLACGSWPVGKWFVHHLVWRVEPIFISLSVLLLRNSIATMACMKWPLTWTYRISGGREFQRKPAAAENKTHYLSLLFMFGRRYEVPRGHVEIIVGKRRGRESVQMFTQFPSFQHAELTQDDTIRLQYRPFFCCATLFSCVQLSWRWTLLNPRTHDVDAIYVAISYSPPFEEDAATLIC